MRASERRAKQILDQVAATAGFERGCEVIEACCARDGAVCPVYELQVKGDWMFNHPVSSARCWISIESPHREGSREARWMASNKWGLLLKKCIEEAEAGYDIRLGCEGYYLGMKTVLAACDCEKLKILSDL